MNDGEKLVRTYSDDKNMMMLKMKYHDNKEMMSMMIIVARTYWWCILYPSPLLTDSNGSEVCSDVVFLVNTNHSYNLNTPIFQISYILNMSTLPWTLATQRCGRAAITSPNDANLQILKRSSQKQKFSCTLNSCCCVCYQYIVVSTHLISLQWREGHRSYYASNSLKQSMWSYRHFWASEFVSTKGTKNTDHAPEEQDFHSPVSSFEGNSFITKFNLVCSVHYLQYA